MKKVIIFICLAGCIFSGLSPAAAAERLAVKADTANIRSGPGLDNDVLWQIEKYHPLVVIENKGAWIKFKDFEEDVGWIHRSLVDDSDTIIVKANNCNVRSGPGTQFDVAFTVNKGVPFQVLERQKRWIKIKHADGDAGWIFNALVW